MTATPRNGLIAKIHIARKDLALSDESYKAVLFGATGKESCKDMNLKELESVLSRFKSLGFSGKPARAGKRKMATGAQAKKIRALWLTLHEMGALRDPSEEALASFVARACGVDDLHWITPAQADRTIKALRGWISRAGGDPDAF